MIDKYRKFYLAKPRKSRKQVMKDFLVDCLQPSGRVEINQPDQWRTFGRAIKEGYITEKGELTGKARTLMAGDQEAQTDER